jgi:hypothetical protein
MDQNKLSSGAYNVDTKQDAKGNTTRSLGLINDTYLGKEILVDSPEIITGKTVKQVYREVDKAKIKPLLAIDANKQSAGMLADTRSASAWYNEVYAKGKNDFCTPLDLATPDGKQRFQDAYLQYIVDTIPDKQAVMTPDNDIATVTDVEAKPVKARSVGGTAKTGKPTKALFTEQEIKDYKSDYADLASGKIEAIDLPVRGKGTMRFQLNNGKIQMVRADGTVLKDRVTGAQFRSYLGK